MMNAPTPKIEQLGLIGCGLMGGSFAVALKKAGLVKRVVGYSKSPSTTERARQMGVIDIEAPSALLAVSGSDVVLLAVPVAATEATFKAIRHLIHKDMLLMDVGSTKRDVVDAARRTLVLAQARWKAGAISHLEVLDAQRSAYSAEQALVSLRLAEQSNRLTLFKVLGGTAA